MSLNPKNPLSVFMGILFSACCLAALVWVTRYLVDAVEEGMNGRLFLVSFVFFISAYWCPSSKYAQGIFIGRLQKPAAAGPLRAI